jgi:hypothetical protein
MCKEKKMPIEQIVTLSAFADQLEIIPVPKNGDRIVLLRIKTMSEYAFVLWAEHQQGTHSQMAFRWPDGACSRQVTVVCACCGSESYGLTKSEPHNETLLKQRFASSMAEVCATHLIQVLFMRRADAWTPRYGSLPNVKVVEANQPAREMRELYGRRPVEQALEFIDYYNSQGMDR